MRPIPQVAPRVAPVIGAATILVVIGAALRLLGLAAGDPFVYPADEWLLVKPAMAMVRTGDWNPHMFFYPSALIDIEAVVVQVVHGLAPISLDAEHPWLYEAELLPDQFVFVMVGRAIVAAMGVATILLAFEAARRLAGLPAAIAAGFAIAVAPLAVEHAHYLTTDVPAAFLCAASLLATIVASRSTRSWPWAVAGLTAGLAGSMKWNGLAVLMVPLLAWALAALGEDRSIRRRRLRIPLIVVGAAAAGLIVTTPAVLLAPAEVADWLARQVDSYDGPNPGPPVNSLVFHLQSLVETFGPLLVFAIVGMAACVRRAWRNPSMRPSAVIPAFTIVYLVAASIPERHFARNLLPIVPFIAVSIGIGVDVLWRALRGVPWPPRLAWVAPVVLVGAVVIAAAPPVLSTAETVDGFVSPDTRDLARTWMLEHVPAGTAIAREAYTPQFSQDEYRLRGSYFLPQRTIDDDRRAGVRYLISSDRTVERYLTSSGGPASTGYTQIYRLPEVFRADPSATRRGPTIRIFELDP